ncbi:unnamed protein product, partial [Ectocarpus sp. 6 AP-2014]
LALLANEQSLEEHFMVYNRRHPTEQYRISLKLTSGALRMFFLSPGSKNAYPFWTLEDKITTFLQAYKWMWSEFLDLEPQLNAVLRERERGGAVFKESGLLVFRRALDHLDAAMIAAGEPRSKICGTRGNSAGGVAATSAAVARSTSQCSDCGDEGGSCGDGRALSSSSSADAAGDPGPLVAVAQQCSRLIFEMFNITDELLFYALKHEGFRRLRRAGARGGRRRRRGPRLPAEVGGPREPLPGVLPVPPGQAKHPPPRGDEEVARALLRRPAGRRQGADEGGGAYGG